MSDIVPIFYDHSSQKSLLTFWTGKDCKPNGPQSIIEIAKGNALKSICFVSTNYATFSEAWRACNDANIKLVFGIEMLFCEDASIKNEASLKTEHKVIIFARNSTGHKDLLKVFSECHAKPENKYYKQRFDPIQLERLWTDNLELYIPFFDGFISKNLLQYGASIMPDFSFCGKNVGLFREQATEHPHEQIINAGIDSFLSVHPNWKQVKTKTIYYKARSDYRAYNVYRAIQNRKPFSSPNLEFFCSPAFCFESWKELTK